MSKHRKKIAIIDRELCNPKRCGMYLCQKVCPINRSGSECVVVSDVDQKPLINEELCIVCGICAKKCPTQAINVVNLPAELDEDPIHRYGKNLFALYRLPVPKKEAVVGLIGPNGVGKSTVIKILSNQMKPNCGLEKEPSWSEIIDRFKGTELHDYLQRLANNKVTVAYKPQNVDAIPKLYSGKVIDFLQKVDEKNQLKEVISRLHMENIVNRDVSDLSGGELQFVAVAATILKDRDFYFFDEPSSYLDIFSRLIVANEIRKLSEKSVVMLVEHDLALCDYLTDYVHILYGEPGAFGIVSKPYGVRIGINTYLEGFIKEENVQFRKEPITFSKSVKVFKKSRLFMSFPAFKKKFENFTLETSSGNLFKGEVIGILGPNGIGKSTFIKMLAGELKPDAGESPKDLNISYKPQRLLLKENEALMTVQEFLEEHIEHKIDKNTKRILNLLSLEKLLERSMQTLSGGELQSVFITSALAKDSEIVLLDEPSAFLDVEQRLRVAKLVRSKAEEKEIPFFVVDHDLLFVDVISDRLMIFDGEPSVKGVATSPTELEKGMNSFLKRLGITYRRDKVTGRPRINKPGSQKDVEQKRKGKYYYT
jgi:ATP-binding cassette subfamily E protein 1